MDNTTDKKYTYLAKVNLHDMVGATCVHFCTNHTLNGEPSTMNFNKTYRMSFSMKIKPLSKEFERKGVRYTQLVKEPLIVVIYRCQDIETGNIYFEVFEYKTSKPHPLDKGDWDVVERYPNDNDFGKWAWCCSSPQSLVKILKMKFPDIIIDINHE